MKNSNFRSKFRSFLRDVVIDVVVVVLLVLFIRNFLFAPFRVHGPSMCNTFNYYEDTCRSGDGEFVLSSRLSTWNLFGWKPSVIDRGDVVIFQAPYSEKGTYFIKRVIGLPGDMVRIENGEVYLKADGATDFVLLEEPYLNENNKGNTQAHRSYLDEFLVPEESYFVLGDNRTQSSDSRRCFRNIGCDEGHTPFLDEDLIEGEVKLVLFPVQHFRLIHSPNYDLN